MDPSGRRKVSDGTEAAPLDVLFVHLSVPEGFSGQGHEGVTLRLEDIGKTVCRRKWEGERSYV